MKDPHLYDGPYAVEKEREETCGCVSSCLEKPTLVSRLTEKDLTNRQTQGQTDNQTQTQNKVRTDRQSQAHTDRKKYTQRQRYRATDRQTVMTDRAGNNYPPNQLASCIVDGIFSSQN